MRTSYKAFLLGIIFTSLTWAIILYFYFSLQYPSGNNSAIYTFPSSSNPGTLPFINKNQKAVDPAVVSNRIDEEEDSALHSDEKAVRYKKTKSDDLAVDDFEASLGIVRNKEDQKMREDGYSHHAFNTLVSSRLDYHREIPDSRHKM